MVDVTQNRSGTVLRVSVLRCDGGGDALRNSVENAVLAASPLPPAPDAALFDRKLRFRFRPR